MKKMILSLVLLAGTAFSADVAITSFTISRTGGGQMNIEVKQEANSQVVGNVDSCKFTLAGALRTQALAILKNQAVLASDSSIRHPYTAAGTWVELLVSYAYENFQGMMVYETKNIQAPLVLLNSKLSNVLYDVEKAARNALLECNH